MKTKTIAAAALAALAIPATAGAAKPETTGSTKAKNQNAPGQACKQFKGQPKAEGQKKTPFAICVSGYKKQAAAEQQAAATQTEAKNPAQTCKGQSKKKAEGQKKSPYATCVVGAAQAQKDAEKTQS